MSDQNSAQDASAAEHDSGAFSLAADNVITASGTAVVNPVTNETSDAPVAPTAAATEAGTESKHGDAEASDNKLENDTADLKIDDTSANKSEQDVTADASASAEKKRDHKRKSTGGAGGGKKLNKKQSMAKMTQENAQPGDYYYIRLKGYPPWPGVVASWDMLPQELIKKKTTSCQNADGTWNEAYQDGGKNVKQRTFPVMYLGTNEFSWMNNAQLFELDIETVAEKATPKMNKALQDAHALAAENHDLAHWKQVLEDAEAARQSFEKEEDERIAKLEKEAEEKAAKKTAAAEKKKTPSKKRKSVGEAAVEGDVDEDVDMDEDGEELNPQEQKKSNKRKASGDADEGTPARAGSSKKPKIKINNNSKATNGDTPKSTTKKTPKVPSAKKTNGSSTTKEPEMSDADKLVKKEKEILFLRHKLQKGLLDKSKKINADEMKQQSDFITKLEQYPDLESSILKNTKIAKVLKAVLKLDEIPREAEFNFKSRSQELLGKWGPALEALNAKNGESAAVESSETANGSSAVAATEDAPMEDAPEAGSTEVEPKAEADAEFRPKAEPEPAEETEEAITRDAAPLDTTA